MTFKEANLRVFKREEVPFVLFQPRVEPWFHYQKKKGKVSSGYEKLNIFQFYDRLGLSMRYPSYWTGLSSPVKIERNEDKIKEIEKGDDKEKEIIIETEKGCLVRKVRRGGIDEWITIKFPVETKDDFLKLIELYKNTEFTFSVDTFEKTSEIFKDRGYPQFFAPRSPYQALWIEWCSYETLIYGLIDFPSVIEDTMKTIEDSYQRFFEEIVNYGKVKILNFGENIDSNIVSPEYFERYCVPYYEKTNRILKKAGIFTHIHIDGSFKPLLKYLKYLPFDGYEALTPKPQGDVTIEEMRENIGDKILIDGLPAVLFLPEYSESILMEYVEKIIKLFYPDLILGISDEIPMATPFEHGVRKLSIVAEYCKKFKTGI